MRSALEVRNAIRHRLFHLRRAAGPDRRAVIALDRDASLARIERWLKRGWLSDVDVDLEKAFLRAEDLSQRHTERLGCRGFDILHAT